MTGDPWNWPTLTAGCAMGTHNSGADTAWGEVKNGGKSSPWTKFLDSVIEQIAP